MHTATSHVLTVMRMRVASNRKSTCSSRMEKRVLICYLERKTLVSIPPETSSKLQFLTEEFRKQCSFQSNVNLAVTFQHYDDDWDDLHRCR